MDTPKPYLVCEGLSKSFNGKTVLNKINLTVHKGERIALLGPSGCGKSTLLNCLSGLIYPDTGQIKLGDTLLFDADTKTAVPAYRRGFSMVFQDFSLWPHMSVLNNVTFGLKNQGVHDQDQQEQALACLEKVGMTDFVDRFPGQLSGGQQQRVAIARALAIKPKVMLFDEPLSALDVKLRETLRDTLTILLQEEGIASLYVTHDQTEAMVFAHRIAVMKEGTIEQLSDPISLYQKPLSRYVASFMGYKNIVPTEEVREFVNQEQQASFVAYRTEHVLVSKEDAGLAATVKGCFYKGGHYEVLARSDNGHEWTAVSDQPLVIEERVTLVPQPNNQALIHE